MAGKKKTPLRKCVITNEMKPKKELVRVVRTPEGEVLVDHTSKKAGRGAYISLDETTIHEAKKKNALSRHLKIEVPVEIYEELMDVAMKGNSK
ncbi:RNase P modulator RnpM [Evansella sp. AB-rgal1]|uniref:RNase P modulator RnpM n=1 Tax=Evansella sp. AB-rgal1 TaxID=3242696 RepID=UPI00359E40F2